MPSVPELEPLPGMVPPVEADPLGSWARRTTRRATASPVDGLRFAFYGRVSTEDHQDPKASKAWQLQRARATIAGAGRIVTEFFDVGYTRVLPWQRRPQAARLIEALSVPDRGFDAIVVGSHERAFFGNQYTLMAPLFVHHGVQLWMPELGGPVDPSIDSIEELLVLLGILAKREIARARARSTTSMAAQVREHGRWQGGRVPYGYRLVDAGPHPNKADARWGRRAHRFGIDPTTGPIVKQIFAMRLARHSLARITAALNATAIPCPSAADPDSNPHRAGDGWKPGTVREILANPIYTGRMVWGRTRTDHDLLDPGNTGLGHCDVMRWNDPGQWVISERAVHPALVSEQDFVTVQGMRADREDAKHTYQLTGLLRCVICQRAFEGHWVHGTPGYRCRHGHTSAKTRKPDEPKNTYLPEKRILAKLTLLHHMLAAAEPGADNHTGAPASAARPTPTTPQEVIEHLRANSLGLAYDPRTRTLEITGTAQARATL